MSVNVTTRSADGITLVRLDGEITSNSAPGVQDRILPLAGDTGRLLIDFTGVPYVSSAGLRMLLLLYRRAQAADAKIVLVGLSEEVRFVMSATGFLDFFEIGDDAETAMGGVRP
ncbi:STAS domain-containing protein [Sphaerisporangium corydalis]|uniref:Anti-sigma factor antagonist n=1 Tax=Sphaerisporangium corydalis TaxID=1441875 RepID=A0ABV9EKW7_9ACTN|nr:STAS domain-containing protein [Sphaerisporangium corydalis]